MLAIWSDTTTPVERVAGGMIGNEIGHEIGHEIGRMTFSLNSLIHDCPVPGFG
ncbi:hypothetical protein [Glaciibacter psychrotolerans]|uniref:Uncharacterized protein n=1 Tax=Glaciibacter psychrotolerans TaxID=670054 RepID=A0A7Z0J623_9MICO|nr:hypothetical protein [Leifsonia psychrotolerans]NYJ19463.1 hypothetical protein [Leifsonia psychrotolerans]